MFRVGEDPVKLGLVSNLAQPGGNATGVNFFEVESLAKRLALLHEFVPDAVHVAVLVDPANTTSAEATLRVQEAARAMGLQIRILNANTIDEIDAAFATLARDRLDALYVVPNGFFASYVSLAFVQRRRRSRFQPNQRVRSLSLARRLTCEIGQPRGVFAARL